MFFGCVWGCLHSQPAFADFLGNDPVAERGDTQLTELTRYAEQLRASDSATRQSAVEALSHLDERYLPAIRARIVRIARRRPEHRWAIDIYNRLRRAAANGQAEEDVDLFDGVIRVLEQSQHRRFQAMTEPLLLWRSLESIGSFEATRAMAPLIALDEGLWRSQSTLIAHRMGERVLPAALLARRHRRRAVRAWSERIITHYGATDPGRAVQERDLNVLPDILRAYAQLRVMDAMPVIISFANHPRRAIRRASREALRSYRRNAIWTLRTTYRNEVGENAPEAWGWERLSDALWAHMDHARLQSVHATIERATEAAHAGHWDHAIAQYDEALVNAPELDDSTSIAHAYANYAASQATQGAWARSAWALRRALRLAPNHPDADTWRGELQFADLETQRQEHIVNEAGYRDVLARIPSHQGAQRVLEMYAPSTSTGAQVTGIKTAWLWMSVVLLVIFGLTLLNLGPRRHDTEPMSAQREYDEDIPTLQEPALDTLADATLPG